MLFNGSGVIFVGSVLVSSGVVMVPVFVVKPVGISVLLKDETLVCSVDTDDGFIEPVLDLVTVVDTAPSDVDEVLPTEADDVLNELETEVSGNGVFCDGDVTKLAVDGIKDLSNDVVIVRVIVLVLSDFVSKLSVVCRSLESV